MTVVAIGSLWKRRFTQTVFAKVVHAIEHTQEGADEPTRWIIYEELHRSRVAGDGRTRTGGMAIMSKSNFLAMFQHPPRQIDNKDIP
jgi:hypothetical protein